MLYPLLFELVQLNMLTLYQYFFNWTTFINLLFLGFGIGNSYLHYFYSPYTIWPKFTLVMTIVFSLLATLLYLRVVQSFSGIVTMLVSVVLDFKGFLFLFTLLLVMFSTILGILQMINIDNNERLHSAAIANPYKYNGHEYKFLNQLISNFFIMLRMSTGDSSIISNV